MLLVIFPLFPTSRMKHPLSTSFFFAENLVHLHSFKDLGVAKGEFRYKWRRMDGKRRIEEGKLDGRGNMFTRSWDPIIPLSRQPQQEYWVVREDEWSPLFTRYLYALCKTFPSVSTQQVDNQRKSLKFCFLLFFLQEHRFQQRAKETYGVDASLNQVRREEVPAEEKEKNLLFYNRCF